MCRAHFRCVRSASFEATVAHDDEPARIVRDAGCLVGAPALRPPRAPHRLGREIAALTQARPHRLVRRQRRRVRPPVRRDGGAARCGGSTPRSARTATSRSPIRPTSRASRTARSSAASARRRRPDQQLGRAGRDARTLRRPVRRLHARAARCTSCRSRWARSAARSRTSASRSPTARMSSSTCALMTRMGRRGVRRARQRRRLRALRAFRRRAARRRANATSRGRATPTTSTSCTSRRRARSGRYGSGYGGNALLGKKCFALRIASVMARDQGWLAEHMLILGVKSPQGEKTYVAAAFPSACGKTNFAMLIPPRGFEGWKVSTIGDDIAWIKPGADGRLYAINPGGRLLRRRAGHLVRVQPQRDGDAEGERHLHQRRADRRRRRVVGGHDQGRRPRTSSTGRARTGRRGLRAQGGAPERALHRAVDPVPVARSANGTTRRRADRRVHLRRRGAATPCRWSIEARDLGGGRLHGGDDGLRDDGRRRRHVGEVRRDPFAMLPFCGYHMGDYFAHWLEMGEAVAAAAEIFASTGSARTTTASSSGRASATTCACCSGSSSAAGHGARGRDRPRSRCPPTTTWSGPASNSAASASRKVTAIRAPMAARARVARRAVRAARCEASSGVAGGTRTARRAAAHLTRGRRALKQGPVRRPLFLAC